MTYKILFLDIDGTILKPDHSYHPKTKEAIEQIQAQGMEVFLATGRPTHELSDLAEELRIESYIGYNGAYTVYQNKNILDAPMKKEIVEAYLRIAKEHNHEIILYTSESNYAIDVKSPSIRNFAELFQVTNTSLLPINEEMTNYVLGATLINVHPEEAYLYEIDKDIRLAEVNVHGVTNCYDVIRLSANKGEAVKVVLKHLGISPDEAIAFGDGMNDKEMLEIVGAGFAMGNAHADLLPFATYRTTSVDEAGVYHGLKFLGLVK
ncbi:Cof-type HAD-IIB family hydrolase [Paucisalibacillus globulus]|uniref:Cof-type HAD-IIB family hydrolase n=1 Tax=Paucisalibacillus globulus TaxID=351095 RepID=UPI000420F96D|nr:Cof-type HAD-IIB family hydrolase [Paucisalibacillus globulus]